MKKELTKILLIFLVTAGAVFFGLNYVFLSGNSIRTRAVDDSKVTLWFDPGTGTPAANAEFVTTIKVKGTSADVQMRGYDMKYTFDKTKLQLKKIEYKLGVVSADLGNADADLPQINQNGIFRIMGELSTSIGQAVNTTGVEVAKLTFTAVSASGTSISVTSKFYTINANATLSENIITSPISIDLNGGGAILSGTPAPAASCTNSNTCINFKLQFQGIKSKPADAQNSMDVKIKLTGCGLTAPVETTAKVTAIDSGVWSGQAGFNLSTCSSGSYIVFVKGPRHLQKKICDPAPTEATAGTYRCSEGKINLVAGQNSLDFSGILLLSGDIDQNGTVDSADISFIRNNLNKTDADTLKKCDINLDGKCDTQDYSLVISALSVKVDEM